MDCPTKGLEFSEEDTNTCVVCHRPFAFAFFFLGVKTSFGKRVAGLLS